MFGKATFPASLCAGLVLVLSIAAACGDNAPPEASALCGGGWPDLDNAIEEAEGELDFNVVAPTYLPATTSSVPEIAIHPREEIRLDFLPCPDTTSTVLGPRVLINETTQDIRLAEPGSSDLPTERIQILGTSMLMQQAYTENNASLAIGWQQAGLSLIGTFVWTTKDSPPPNITEQMKTEAIRVVESIIRQ